MFPKMGRKLHHGDANQAFARMMAEVLTEELGKTHQAIKIAIRWTGASERSVKHWFAGTHSPRSSHLLALMRHSDGVLRQLLIEAGRDDMLIVMEAGALRRQLVELLALIDVQSESCSETER